MDEPADRSEAAFPLLERLRCSACGSIEWRLADASVIADTTRGKARLGVFRGSPADSSAWVCVCGVLSPHADQTAVLDALRTGADVPW
jgi:hypothetical protein